jgi:uncharacterized protein (DUF362 family)
MAATTQRCFPCCCWPIWTRFGLGQKIVLEAWLSGMNTEKQQNNSGVSRRDFLLGAVTGGAVVISGGLLGGCERRKPLAATFIGRVERYGADIASVIFAGLREVGVLPHEIRGKRILLKPNLVEPHAGVGCINTHPLVVRGAAEAFLRYGAAQVLVAEGPGHCRDSLLVLEESGMREVLREDRIPFIDLNYVNGYTVANAGRFTNLATLTFPETVKQVDWIVSMPKMKTHHWAGVTLSMKNMFGILPGNYYGWPKNLLHFKGIEKSIIDINATVQPHFAIVDGIVGMEGDGPIMGTPRQAGVLVMGRSLPAVDATCARVMGIDPKKVGYLAAASERLGPISESAIVQHGETVRSVRTDFTLLDYIPAHKGLRLL